MAGEIMVTKDAQTQRKRAWQAVAPVGGSLLAASLLICHDIVLCGSYVGSYLACPVWLVVSIVALFVQRPSARVAIARVLFPLVTLLLVLANYSLQKSIATANAAKIVRACESYREANGSYPDRLDELVPVYVNSIPRAKYCCSWGEFVYYRSPRYPILWWYPMPFAKMVYNFDTRTWCSID